MSTRHPDSDKTLPFRQHLHLVQSCIVCKHFANELDETEGYQGAQNVLKRGRTRYKMRSSDAEKHSLAQPNAVFKTASIGHSDTPPDFEFYPKTCPGDKSAEILQTFCQTVTMDGPRV